LPTYHIGCCGWSYIKPHEFDDVLDGKYNTKLQAYAQLYNVVEINSTYYGIPKLPTARKWREEVDAVNSRFQFTVKAYQGITHRHRFGANAVPQFRQLEAVCRAVDARIALFQSPANFAPTVENANKLREFFRITDRGNFVFVWEPRGKWYDEPHIVQELCEELDLVHCVDPFRNEPLGFGTDGIAYFRLHGFGRPTMYHYDFSEQELDRLHAMIETLPAPMRHAYIMFNNAACYTNARTFLRMVTLEV
jgi:uncharacterized protein YecE (DUF72 family)